MLFFWLITGKVNECHNDAKNISDAPSVCRNPDHIDQTVLVAERHLLFKRGTT
jgi:hypothetical protein